MSQVVLSAVLFVNLDEMILGTNWYEPDEYAWFVEKNQDCNLTR